LINQYLEHPLGNKGTGQDPEGPFLVAVGIELVYHILAGV